MSVVDRAGRTERVRQWWHGLCARHPRVDRVSRAVSRYHERNIEYFALRVIVRGLFLAVTTMLVFIYAIGRVSSVIPGDNEITVPTTDLPSTVDVGLIAQNTLSTSSGRLLSVVGVVTLLVSAFYTGRALRDAAAEVFRKPPAERSPVARWLLDGLRGLLVALLVLTSWLLALATTVRTRVILTLTGADISRPAVNAGKWVLLVLSVALIAAVVYFSLRRAATGARKRDLLLASVLFGLFMTVMNLLLLYTYIAAIIDPHTSGGVVLVLTVLAWVNLVIRALLLAQCWVAAPADPAPG